MPRRFSVLAFLFVPLLLPAPAEGDDSVREIGDRWEPMVDRWLIDRMVGVELRQGCPQPAGVALKFDRPWEGAFCGYVTVFADGPSFWMYYRGLPESGADGGPGEVTCCAQSSDGITWTKPELSIYEVHGTRANNVVLADAAPATHNFAPFLDSRSGVPADERFKALGGVSPGGLVAFVSGDGLHWRKLQTEPVFNDSGWVFDSQNVASWSPAEHCYVLYYRKSEEGFRAVARATSTDFVHWSPGVQMSFGDTPREHLYTNQTQPYFRAPHVYVGIAARFMPGRQVITAEEAAAIKVDPKYFGDVSDAVLLTTRGDATYQRTFLEAFVRPGRGLENWISRTNYPARGLVETAPGEMSFYIQKNYGQPTGHLLRYTLRTDGFGSVHASQASGEMVTHPLRFHSEQEGKRELVLNASTSAAGLVRVELQDGSGTALPGFSLGEAIDVIGDDLEKVVRWKGGSDLSSLADRPIRIRMVMQDADVYSLRVR